MTQKLRKKCVGVGQPVLPELVETYYVVIVQCVQPNRVGDCMRPKEMLRICIEDLFIAGCMTGIIPWCSELPRIFALIGKY